MVAVWKSLADTQFKRGGGVTKTAKMIKTQKCCTSKNNECYNTYIIRIVLYIYRYFKIVFINHSISLWSTNWYFFVNILWVPSDLFVFF